MNTLRYFDFGASRSLLLLIARIAVVVLFILFGYPKLLGFGGTVQYMAASGAPMPTLAAIIAVIMEVPAAILIVLGFFTRPLAVIFIFYTLGTAVIGHHYWDMTGDAVLPNMIVRVSPPFMRTFASIYLPVSRSAVSSPRAWTFVFTLMLPPKNG